MKKVLFLILFLLSSCGYQPLYINKDNTNFKFQKITLEGDKNLSRIILTSLSLKELTSDKSLNKIIVESDKQKTEASKNAKGHVIKERVHIKVNLTIIDQDNIKIKNKFFSKDFLYNVNDDKFKTSEYQREIENNLINKIIEEIVIYLNL